MIDMLEIAGEARECVRKGVKERFGVEPTIHTQLHEGKDETIITYSIKRLVRGSVSLFVLEGGAGSEPEEET